MRTRWWVCLCIVLATSACRVVPDDPLRPRFFTPEAPLTSSATPVDSKGPALRLGWVRAAEHLGFRMVYREDAQVFRFYEQRRWNESPAVYLERALRRRLFVEQGLERSVDPHAPTLDVTLLAFEEVHDGKEPWLARVTLAWVLLSDTRHLGEGTVVVGEAMGPPDKLEDEDTGPLLARSLGHALERAIDELSRALRPHLEAKR